MHTVSPNGPVFHPSRPQPSAHLLGRRALEA
jgi:hypothetical protein